MGHRETEIKLPIESSPALMRRRLLALGAETIRPRHFEDNFVLDFPDGRIGRRRCLIRVRLTGGGRGLLTYKGPGRILSGAKSRLEIESGLEDGPSTLRVLDRIGLRPRFRYQKYRTLFRTGRLLIAMDETPIGNFLEVEGSPGRIHAVASELGFDPGRFITASYRDLYVEYRKVNHIGSPHMLFRMDRSGRP